MLFTNKQTKTLYLNKKLQGLLNIIWDLTKCTVIKWCEAINTKLYISSFFSESYRLGKSNVSLAFETILQLKILLKP